MAADQEGLAEELEELIGDGERIHWTWQVLAAHAEDQKQLDAVIAAHDTAVADAPPPGRSLGGSLPSTMQDIGRAYQAWYSMALGVIEQLLPARYGEFRALYGTDKRATLDLLTYGIRDLITGFRMQQGGKDLFNHEAVAFQKFRQQIDILRSAHVQLTSLLADIRATLESALLDDELSAAADLHKSKYLRSAGIVAGVALERHLKRLIKNHKVVLRKKKPQLGDLNQALKDAGIYDTATWRRIQYLTDVRNLCGHDADREPLADEVEELIQGVSKTVKTVF